MMRFSPSFLAVELLRNGLTPQEAAERVIDRIQEFYPRNFAAIVVVDKNGNFGAACQVFTQFPISIYYPGLEEVNVETTVCRQPTEGETTSIGGGTMGKVGTFVTFLGGLIVSLIL